MKVEKVFAVADQKYVGMTVAYAVDGDAAKVPAPADPKVAAEWFTEDELYQAFVAGSLVIASVTDGEVTAYERATTLTFAEPNVYAGASASVSAK